MDFSTTRLGRKGLQTLWRALRLDTCTLVDIGARGGVDDRWQLLGDHLRLVAFEADPAEGHRLNELTSDKRTIVLAHALHEKQQVLTFNLCRSSAVSSCYPPNVGFLKRFPYVDRFDIMTQLSLDARTLDDALSDQPFSVDFVKVDAQGA